MTDLQVQDFNYVLPEDRIARFPLSKRDGSKLLHYKAGVINDCAFEQFPQLLNVGDLLVMNNTKVIRARLIFKKKTGLNVGSEIEIFCLKPLRPSTFDEALGCANYCVWECAVGHLRKWKVEDLHLEFIFNDKKQKLTAVKVQRDCLGVAVRFEWTGNALFSEVLEICGNIPIPPYLKRISEDIDANRYQTVFSKHSGSVAAPTAGLHFTPDLLEQIREKRIETTEITLHVGAGTFIPMRTDKVSEHIMHDECFRIEKTSLKKIIKHAGNIIAVGTTSLRMLESMYWLGVRIHQGKGWSEISQWEAYENTSNLSVTEALENVLRAMESIDSDHCYATTQILIVPGYRFRIIKGLVTNFHQPQSTLLLLVAALMGKNWRTTYQHALDHDYRFLSYGDGSLIMCDQEFQFQS